MSLKQKAFSGILWKFIEQASVGIAGFVISIVLARLLSPSDYGLIGMLSVFIALSSTIVESGFGSALIQKRDRTAMDMNTVFLFNVFISVVCYLILYLSAPFIAGFYKTPLLIPILKVLGLNIIINSFNSIQRTQLQIKIDFKTSAKVSFTGLVAGGIVAVVLAYKGFGVWSLVAQSLTNALITTVAFWFYSAWRPSLAFSFDSLKSLFRFGSKLLLGGVYAISLNNMYDIIIGKVYKSEELGIYTRANQLPSLISTVLNTVINSVTFPLMSAVNDDRERMVNIYGKMLSMTAFVVFPVMTLLAILSKPFVSVVLTDKWIAIVPLMQCLCFVRMLTPVSALNLNILNAAGRPDLFLKTDLYKFPLIVLNMVITIPLGIKYVAIGSMVVTILGYFINTYFPGKILGYGAMRQMKDCAKIVGAVCIMSILTIPWLFIIQNQGLMLLAGGTTGGISFLTACYVLKVKELDEFKSACVEIIRKL